MITLNNKNAVITGAGSGIGAAIAKTFCMLGAHVFLLGRTEKKLKETALSCKKELDAKCDYFVADVKNEQSLREVNHKISEKKGGVDILITCAAAEASAGKTQELNFAEWKSVLETDLDGVFLSCKSFSPSMLKKGCGRIINLTSFHTVATYPERIAYNAAKSGVLGITRALAVEWGSYGITVNAVAPGPIRTPRTLWFLSQSPDVEEGMLGRTPNVRLGEPEDVAALVAFLASEHAKHINGQQIVVDGGWTKNAWWGAHSKKYA